jgi:hypothetical protein
MTPLPYSSVSSSAPIYALSPSSFSDFPSSSPTSHDLLSSPPLLPSSSSPSTNSQRLSETDNEATALKTELFYHFLLHWLNSYHHRRTSSPSLLPSLSDLDERILSLMPPSFSVSNFLAIIRHLLDNPLSPSALPSVSSSSTLVAPLLPVSTSSLTLSVTSPTSAPPDKKSTEEGGTDSLSINQSMSTTAASSLEEKKSLSSPSSVSHSDSSSSSIDPSLSSSAPSWDVPVGQIKSRLLAFAKQLQTQLG